MASNCVVVVVSVPHELPPQPVPESLQLKVEFRFEFGIGVSVATIVVDDLVAMLLGPESCSVKLLVTVKLAVANLDASAALGALTTTLDVEDKICGAA